MSFFALEASLNDNVQLLKSTEPIKTATSKGTRNRASRIRDGYVREFSEIETVAARFIMESMVSSTL